MASSSRTPCAAMAQQGHDHCDQCEVRHLAVCSALDDGDVSRLEEIVTHVRLDDGQSVFEEGDDSDHVYNVSGGTIRLYKLLPNGRRQVTGFLFPGDFLGLASHGIYSYGAEAVTPVHLCRFRTRDLEKMFDEFPKLKSRLLDMATDELAAAQEQMLLLGRKTPLEKMASFLLRLSRNNIKWGRPASPVNLAMSRGDIADYLGLTIETVSRTFTRLKKDGLIHLEESHTVEMIDMDRLEDLAEES